jgi:hypothetical protein
MNFLVQYWYLIALVVVVAAIYGANRLLKGRAKAVALQYLLAAEKMVFTTTESKLTVVADLGYKALPVAVKALVSPVAFELMVTSAYGEVKGLIDKLNADPSVPAQKAVESK